MKNEYYDWPWKAMDTIPVDNGLNTLLRLNPEFPLAISHDNLSLYKNGFVNWHKQGSIEISVVREGTVTVNLLNYQKKIKAGEGFLILPGILHSIRGSKEEGLVRYDTILCDPCLLTGFKGSYYENNYYKPKILNKNSFFHFSMEDKLLCSYKTVLEDVFRDIYWGNPYLENKIQQKLQEIWIVLWENVITVQSSNSDSGKMDDARLLTMVDFIQKNFRKKFVLDELCNYVNLSRSACCRYFKKMMNITISEYVVEYRLSQAIYMLENSDRSITEIAVENGFSSTSYFISRFKEKMSMTPMEYKRKTNPLSLHEEGYPKQAASND